MHPPAEQSSTHAFFFTFKKLAYLFVSTVLLVGRKHVDKKTVPMTVVLFVLCVSSGVIKHDET